MALYSGGGNVCNMLAEHDGPVIEPFPFPPHVRRITLAPDDIQIAIQGFSSIQVWSLRQFRDIHDFGPRSVLGIDLSSDTSLLAIRTRTEVEIWNARMGRCHHVIQSKSHGLDGHIAFSPRGELIAFISRDGIIVIDVQRPTTYSVMKGQDIAEIKGYRRVGISFDSSMLAASAFGDHILILIWDLPGGALLHTISDHSLHPDFRWSRTDLYLACSYRKGGHIYLNAKTFQQEVISDVGDRFGKHDHLYLEENMLHIRSPRRRKDPLFLALPSYPDFKTFRCHGDRISILSGDGLLLLLNISGLDAYMKEFCLEPECELCADLLNLLTK